MTELCKGLYKPLPKHSSMVLSNSRVCRLCWCHTVSSNLSGRVAQATDCRAIRPIAIL